MCGFILFCICSLKQRYRDEDFFQWLLGEEQHTISNAHGRLGAPLDLLAVAARAMPRTNNPSVACIESMGERSPSMGARHVEKSDLAGLLADRVEARRSGEACRQVLEFKFDDRHSGGSHQ